jgi:hypothetical protein
MGGFQRRRAGSLPRPALVASLVRCDPRPVSIFTRLTDWIDARVDRPADQTVLDDPRGGSERIIEADSPEVGQAAGDSVRREGARRTRRSRFLSR